MIIFTRVSAVIKKQSWKLAQRFFFFAVGFFFFFRMVVLIN